MRNLLVWMIVCVVGCTKHEKPSTAAASKVVEWNRGPTAFSTGVSLGKDLGTPISDKWLVTFTPNDRRDTSLGIVRFEMKMERGDVAIEPNPQGDRPAETGTAPRHIEVTVTENHGWLMSGKCDPKVNGPGSGAARNAVTFTQTCSVQLTSGEDNGGVAFVLSGEGKQALVPSFGTATSLP